MVKLINLTKSVDFSKYTLIIPSVSVGNVGQLTVDLMITTFNLKKMGTIWHPAIIPSVAGDPYSLHSKESSTACELYGNEELNIATIQLRSSIEFKLALDFFRSLKAEIINLKFNAIVILTTIFAYEQHNIQSSHFCYITNTTNKFENLDILPMPLNEIGKHVANGSGFAIKLFELLKDCVKCTVIAKYVSEGDNRPDAIALFNLVENLDISNANNCSIKIPVSWTYVFGNPPPIGIF